MQSSIRTSILSLVVATTLFPWSASAATKFEVSGWIPYWRSATGTADVIPHLDDITEVNPFVFTLKKDGTLVDNGSLDVDPWLSFIGQAKAKKVRIIPSVMASDGATIHGLLSDTQKRQKLEDDIAALVTDKGYDGIDIDFEGKFARTRPYFSKFLKGLYNRIGDKFLMCTIEARTPPEYLYKTIPNDLEYANDFVQINKYCDRVKFMTYDQQNAVYALNQANKSVLYTPLSDVRWVEMAIRFAMKTINKNKIMLGIPTYGYEYRVGGAVGAYDYKLLWTFNHRYALQLAQEYGVQPTRNAAGEMGIAFVPTSTQAEIGQYINSNLGDVMMATPVGQDTGVTAGTVSATTAPVMAFQTNFRYLIWSDAVAIKQKTDLAQRLGVRGVSIFKWDGGEDPLMWEVLHGLKK